MNSPLPIFSEPSNNKCSKKWANPVLPSSLSLPPTSYITDVITTGAVLSWCKITCKPFSKSNSVKSTCWPNDTEKIKRKLNMNLFFINIRFKINYNKN